MPVLRRRVAQTTEDVLLASTRTERRGGIRVENDAEAILYLNEGAAATTTAFMAKLLPGGVWREPHSISDIHGLWAAAGGGAAEVTEYL